MPGPVSDSYDPEFGTGDNAYDIRDHIESLIQVMTAILGTEELKNIVEVAQTPATRHHTVALSDKELHVLRFALNRALESI